PFVASFPDARFDIMVDARLQQTQRVLPSSQCLAHPSGTVRWRCGPRWIRSVSLLRVGRSGRIAQYRHRQGPSAWSALPSLRNHSISHSWMTDFLQHWGEAHQRLSHADYPALAHAVAECELGRRKHDDRRAMLEPTHLLALAQSGMARNEI